MAAGGYPRKGIPLKMNPFDALAAAGDNDDDDPLDEDLNDTLTDSTEKADDGDENNSSGDSNGWITLKSASEKREARKKNEEKEEKGAISSKQISRTYQRMEARCQNEIYDKTKLKNIKEWPGYYPEFVTSWNGFQSAMVNVLGVVEDPLKRENDVKISNIRRELEGQPRVPLTGEDLLNVATVHGFTAGKWFFFKHEYSDKKWSDAWQKMCDCALSEDLPYGVLSVSLSGFLADDPFLPESFKDKFPSQKISLRVSDFTCADVKTSVVRFLKSIEIYGKLWLKPDIFTVMDIFVDSKKFKPTIDTVFLTNPKQAKTIVAASKKQPSAGAGSAAAVSYPPNYKRVLCVYYSQPGGCKFGADCSFAHGKKDLRTDTHNA